MKRWGYVFIILSGVIYTLEHVGYIISGSLIEAGFYAGKHTGASPDMAEFNLFDNLFIPIFFILGIFLISYKYIKK